MALIAASVSLFQIAIMRVFSFTIWHHFSFMVISVALLGFAASGVLLQRLSRLSSHPIRNAAWATLGFSVTALAATRLVGRIPFDPTRIAEGPEQLVSLSLYYPILFVPFACAGLAIVLLLRGFTASVGRVYAADLTGAGVGSLATISMLDRLGAEGLILGAAATAAIAAALLARTDGAGSPLQQRAALLAAIALLLSLPIAPRLLPIAPGPGKALHGFLDQDRFPEARLAHTEWNALSRIDVVENSGTVRWTDNPHRPVHLPPQIQILIDGDAATPIVSATAAEDLSFLDSMLPSAALQSFRPGRVLVIGAGGGVDVLGALRHGAERVDALEINPAIVRLVQGPYAAWSGHLYDDERVELHTVEGRSYVRRRDQQYDLIQLSLVDTWAASASGAYSLSESYLYTTEAFVDYLRRLDDSGALTITRWLWSPPRETLKLCATAVAALEQLGVNDPARHIVVLALGRIGSVIVKRSPFTDGDLDSILRVAQEHGFTFLYAPEALGTNEFSEMLGADDRDAWFRTYRFDVKPATDDRPFFFQFGRWRDLAAFRDGWSESLLVLSGRLVLLTTLVQALVLSGLLLVLPTARARAETPVRGRAWVLLYFAAIGASFMLVEISMMQRFTLFLGHPVYAIAGVLAVLLVAAGFGSTLTSSRLAARIPSALPFGAIAVLCLAYGLLLPLIFDALLGLPLAGRIVITIALLLPLGILLGMPFPLAVASLHARGAGSALGWAWAANGCASVIGPLLAVMVAMDFGFDAVLAIAAAGYIAAWATLDRWSGAATATEIECESPRALQG